MPDPITGSIILGVGSSLMSNSAQNSAADKAAAAQNSAEAGGIAARKGMFDISQSLLQPYIAAGIPATEAMQRIVVGENNNPEYEAMMGLSNKAMADTALATGGPRSGAAGITGSYSPLLMKQLTDQRYTKLAGLNTLGQKSALGLGGTAVDNSGNIVQSQANKGQISQNLSTVQDQLAQQNLNLLPQVLGMYLANRNSNTLDSQLNKLAENKSLF
jgi:hypothetical protein